MTEEKGIIDGTIGNHFISNVNIKETTGDIICSVCKNYSLFVC